MNKPIYFPIERGLYEVAPGLKPLGADAGNGDWDKKVFQIDSDFPLFRQNKIACRKERLSKYEQRQDLDAHSENELARKITELLLKDHPEHFQLNNFVLKCLHTGDEIEFTSDFVLKNYKSSEDVGPKPTTLLDALALQYPEDIALTRRQNGLDWIAYLHLCAPSHWAAEDKIGMNFSKVHEPIPHIEKINKAAANMIEAMINKGPFVRFIWSFVTDQRLNHHPVAPDNWATGDWKGRSFAKEKDSPFDFRVERQVVYGLPHIEASLFTIRISFIPGLDIKNNSHQNGQLLAALRSMSPESRVYKGVSHCFEDLTHWLESK